MNKAIRSEHILVLAEEIISDIESRRISSESLVLKATRLANLTGSERVQKWLSYEKYGYNKTEPLSLEYLRATGRVSNDILKTVYYGSLAAQESAMEGYKLRLENLKYNPEEPKPTSFSRPNFATPRLDQTLVNFILIHQGIINKATSLIHNFATTIYYERLFSNITENIFENFKNDVDNKLSENCGDVLQKIPSIYNRLSEGDTESISQALTSCRRIIDTFADIIYPPTDSTLDIGGGNVLKLTAQHHQNRINAYIRERVSSDSRRTKLRQSLKGLYERVSAGVHSDVSLTEAKTLFLETYLLLGEILSLE